MDSNKNFPVNKSLGQNLEYIKNAFKSGKNFDFVIREFDISTPTEPTKAFLIFFDGLANKEFINRDIFVHDVNVTDIFFNHMADVG